MLEWLKKYGWLLLFGVGALVGWALASRTRVTPMKRIRAESKRIDVEAAVKKLQAEEKYEEALQKVEVEYAEESKALDDESFEMAQILKNDPVALARFLSTAGED